MYMLLSLQMILDLVHSNLAISNWDKSFGLNTFEPRYLELRQIVYLDRSK